MLNMVGSWFYVHALDMSPSRLRKSLVVRGMKEREKVLGRWKKRSWCGVCTGARNGRVHIPDMANMRRSRKGSYRCDRTVVSR